MGRVRTKRPTHAAKPEAPTPPPPHTYPCLTPNSSQLRGVRSKLKVKGAVIVQQEQALSEKQQQLQELEKGKISLSKDQEALLVCLLERLPPNPSTNLALPPRRRCRAHALSVTPRSTQGEVKTLQKALKKSKTQLQECHKQVRNACLLPCARRPHTTNNVIHCQIEDNGQVIEWLNKELNDAKMSRLNFTGSGPSNTAYSFRPAPSTTPFSPLLRNGNTTLPSTNADLAPSSTSSSSSSTPPKTALGNSGLSATSEEILKKYSRVGLPLDRPYHFNPYPGNDQTTARPLPERRTTIPTHLHTIAALSFLSQLRPPLREVLASAVASLPSSECQTRPLEWGPFQGSPCRHRAPTSPKARPD